MYMSDMPMGSNSMGTGTPRLFDLQKIYWTVLGWAISVATVVNILNRLLAQHRVCSSYGSVEKHKFRLSQIARFLSHSSKTQVSLPQYIRHHHNHGPRNQLCNNPPSHHRQIHHPPLRLSPRMTDQNFAFVLKAAETGDFPLRFKGPNT